jgi:hypothetical protein
MNDPLALDRFQELADAYGGVVARWPESYRDAAFRFAATPAGVAILERASELDTRLDEWKLPSPSADLSSRIATRGPMAVESLGSRLRWWSGMAIAATLAGAVAGTAAVAMVAPTDVVTSSTSFGDLPGTDS